MLRIPSLKPALWLTLAGALSLSQGSGAEPVDDASDPTRPSELAVAWEMLPEVASATIERNFYTAAFKRYLNLKGTPPPDYWVMVTCKFYARDILDRRGVETTDGTDSFEPRYQFDLLRNRLCDYVSDKPAEIYRTIKAAADRGDQQAKLDFYLTGKDYAVQQNSLDEHLELATTYLFDLVEVGSGDAARKLHFIYRQRQDVNALAWGKFAVELGTLEPDVLGAYERGLQPAQRASAYALFAELKRRYDDSASDSRK